MKSLLVSLTYTYDTLVPYIRQHSINARDLLYLCHDNFMSKINTLYSHWCVGVCGKYHRVWTVAEHVVWPLPYLCCIESSLSGSLTTQETRVPVH